MDNRALRAGFAAKLLPRAAVLFDAFIEHSCRSSRVIRPAMDVRPYPVEINIGIAPFRHAQQDLMHSIDGASDDRQLISDDSGSSAATARCAVTIAASAGPAWASIAT